MGKLPTPVTREEIYLDAIAKGSGGGGSSSADDVSYDNTTSGLTADNVQDAIDEIAQSGGGGITYDIDISGTSTNGDEPISADLENATYTFKTTMDSMLRKVQDRGMLDICGILHWVESGEGSLGETAYIPLTCTNHPTKIFPKASVETVAPGLTDKDVINITISCMTTKANAVYNFYIYEEKGTEIIKKLVM